MPVRLVFTMGWDPVQLLINVSTRSRAAHVAIGLGDHLLHAYEPGITLEPREAYLGNREQHVVAEYDVLPYVDDNLRDALAHIGRRCSTLSRATSAPAPVSRCCSTHTVTASPSGAASIGARSCLPTCSPPPRPA
jgi:hypothetical protein